MDIDYLAIGKRIKAYRKERKMSQEELAEEIDISVPHMCNIENGKTKFSLPILVGLANALAVRPDALLYDQIGEKGQMRALVLEEIEAQLADCTEVQMQMLGEAFCNEKKLLMEYEKKLKEAVGKPASDEDGTEDKDQD